MAERGEIEKLEEKFKQEKEQLVEKLRKFEKDLVERGKLERLEAQFKQEKEQLKEKIKNLENDLKTSPKPLIMRPFFKVNDLNENARKLIKALKDARDLNLPNDDLSLENMLQQFVVVSNEKNRIKELNTKFSNENMKSKLSPDKLVLRNLELEQGVKFLEQENRAKSDLNMELIAEKVALENQILMLQNNVKTLLERNKKV